MTLAFEAYRALAAWYEEHADDAPIQEFITDTLDALWFQLTPDERASLDKEKQ